MRNEISQINEIQQTNLTLLLFVRPCDQSRGGGYN